LAERVIKRGTSAKLGKVDGDLRIGKNVKIAPESGKKIVVTGTATLEGRAIVEGSFECQSIVLKGRGWGPEGDVDVEGDLTVRGTTDLDGTLRVSGTISSGDMDVAGHMRAGSIASKRLRVGGHLEVKGRLEAGDVDVGGHMKVRDEVMIRNLNAGGHATIGGGRIDGEIKVRGHLTTERALAFGTIQVYGRTTLPAGCSGERISALGKVEFEGDADCKELVITGGAIVRGNMKSENVEVRGSLTAGGNMLVANRFGVFGAVDAKGAIECRELGVSGKLTAGKLSSSERTYIVGEVNTRSGLKSEFVAIGKGSKVTGPLIGNQVDIGKEVNLGSMWGLPWWRNAVGRITTVEDVYGRDVRIGPNSHARRVLAEVVEFADGGMAEEVNYTKELRLPKNYHLTKPPVKVASLPDSPF